MKNMQLVQKNVDVAETYLYKVSEIVDRYEDGTISMDEANEIAQNNNIDITDLKIVHSLAYISPETLVKLLKNLREEISDTKRNELIAQAVIDEYIDIDVLDELVLTYKLCENDIIGLTEKMRVP